MKLLLFVKFGSLSVSHLSQADITYAIDSICTSWCVMCEMFYVLCHLLYLYFVYRILIIIIIISLSVLEGFQWNLPQNIHHVSGNCWRSFKGQRSKVKVIVALDYYSRFVCFVTSHLQHVFLSLRDASWCKKLTKIKGSSIYGTKYKQDPAFFLHENVQYRDIEWY